MRSSTVKVGTARGVGARAGGAICEGAISGLLLGDGEAGFPANQMTTCETRAGLLVMRRMFRPLHVVASAVLLATITGCAGVPSGHTFVSQGYRNTAYGGDKVKGRLTADPADDKNARDTEDGTDYYRLRGSSTEGVDFCQDLARRGRKNAIQHKYAGITFGALALAAAGTGIAVGAAGEPTADKAVYKVTIAAAPLLAGLLTYLAKGQLDMSENSFTLAGASTLAMTKQNQREASDACNSALASWEQNSVSGEQALTQAIAEMKEERKAREKKAADDKAAEEAKAKEAAKKRKP